MPAMRVTRPLPGDDDDPEVSAPMPLTPLVAPTPPAQRACPRPSRRPLPRAPVAPVTAGPAAAP